MAVEYQSAILELQSADATLGVNFDRLSSVCIVAHNAYAALVNSMTGHVGGVEHQTTMLARWLAERGVAVSLITWDDAGRKEETVDGVRVIPTCGRSDGLPGLRFVHPRWSSLCRALRKADAELYYQNGAEAASGQVALWCKRNRRRFVFSVAADSDLKLRKGDLSRYRDNWFVRHAIRYADGVIVQTVQQQKVLQQCRQSTVLSMPCEGPSAREFHARKQSSVPSRVLWVGRIVPVKRVEWLVELAARCPEIAFDVAGPLEDEVYGEQILEKARVLPNLVWHGRQSRDRLASLYQTATCLVCTSTTEGFPNTFLEAWSWGTPVVSTIDVGGLLAERGLGIVAPDLSGIQMAIQDLAANQDRRAALSIQARRYFEMNHTVDQAMSRFADYFIGVSATARP